MKNLIELKFSLIIPEGEDLFSFSKKFNDFLNQNKTLVKGTGIMCYSEDIKKEDNSEKLSPIFQLVNK